MFLLLGLVSAQDRAYPRNFSSADGDITRQKNATTHRVNQGG